MKTKEGFNDEYNLLYKDIIQKIQNGQLKKYKKMKNKFYIELAILIIIIIVVGFIINKENMSSYYLIVFIILSLILVIGLFAVNLKLLKKEKKIICYVLNTMLYKYIVNYLSNDNFFFETDTQISQDDFNKMNLFNLNYLHFSGENLTAASYCDKKFVMSDVWLYDLVDRIKTDSYYSNSSNTKYIINYHYQDSIDIFKGLYYESTINRDNNKYIYLIPNNLKDKFIQKNIYHYINYKGMKVELENLDFSERYSVFSLDEIQSRYILSLTLMEKINRLDELIKYKKYFVFKPDGRVGIYIDGFQLSKIMNQIFDINMPISMEYVDKLFITIKKLFDMSQILEDINTYK